MLVRTSKPVVVCSILSILFLVDHAPGTEKVASNPESPQSRTPVRLEVMDMPPGIPAARTSPAAHTLRGGPSGASVQVNVDANGNNIVGDAANETSITVDPGNPNRMAIGWRQFDTIASNFREAGYAYSTDGGRHWTFPGVIDNGVFRSDPVLDTSPDGTFYYNSLTNVPDYLCKVFKSANGGQTWPTNADAFGGDKQWMVVDRTNSIGRGYIYCHWRQPFSSTPDGIFCRSTDGGLTFPQAVPITNNPGIGTCAVGPDGEVYVAGVNEGNHSQFFVSKSFNAKDSGATPTFPQSTSPSMGGPIVQGGTGSPNSGGLNGQVNIAVDTSGGPRNGWVYVLASVNPAGTDPMDVNMSRSTDGGLTWSAAIKVSASPASSTSWQWFGTLAVAPNGRLDVVYNSSQNTGVATQAQLFYRSSGDGGTTWSAEQQLSNTWASNVGYPQQNKIGDYYELVSDNVGAHLAWAATFNGEQDAYYLRIGDYDCNQNDIGDSLDISGGTSTDYNGNTIPDACEGLGDMNCDGLVDARDIAPFVLAVLDPAGYATLLPACSVSHGDINGDSATSDGDTDPFASLVANPGN